MRLVFWLNCLSPHQLPYIVHLMDDERVDKVAIVTGCAMEKTRKEMGWDVTSVVGLRECDIHISPPLQVIGHLLAERTTDSIHLFSGIRGFGFVFSVFRKSLSFNVKRGLIVERPNTFAFGHPNGKPLWLHRLRWQLQDRKYFPMIDYVFAMGEDAVSFFRSLNHRWKVFPFAYCTKQIDTGIQMDEFNKSETGFCFVGSLSWRKNVALLLEATHCIICKRMLTGGVKSPSMVMAIKKANC